MLEMETTLIGGLTPLIEVERPLIGIEASLIGGQRPLIWSGHLQLDCLPPGVIFCTTWGEHNT